VYFNLVGFNSVLYCVPVACY